MHFSSHSLQPRSGHHVFSTTTPCCHHVAPATVASPLVIRCTFISSLLYLSLHRAPPPSLPPCCSGHRRVAFVGSLHLLFLHLHFVHDHFVHLLPRFSATVMWSFLQGKFPTRFCFIFRFVYINFQF